MDEDRFDLTPLDPSQDRQHFDRLIGSIMERADDELARRRVAASPIMQLVNWRRPMLAAAALVAVVSAGILVSVDSPELDEEATGVAEAIGMPNLLAQGLRTSELPTTVDLYEAFRGLQ